MNTERGFKAEMVWKGDPLDPTFFPSQYSTIVAVAFGLLIIGLAFLLQVVPAGVLRIAFSIFGAIGGPILTIFTLGMICPFVNKWVSLRPFPEKVIHCEANFPHLL